MRGQLPDVLGAGGSVPHLINFSGSVKDASGTPVSGTVDLTFSLYGLPDGGSPLWVESQKVQLDEEGHYTVVLGTTTPSGLPLDLFVSGKSLWLGVQPELPGQGEQPWGPIGGSALRIEGRRCRHPGWQTRFSLP